MRAILAEAMCPLCFTHARGTRGRTTVRHRAFRNPRFGRRARDTAIGVDAAQALRLPAIRTEIREAAAPVSARVGGHLEGLGPCAQLSEPRRCTARAQQAYREKEQTLCRGVVRVAINLRIYKVVR